jgi:hypothetical protein
MGNTPSFWSAGILPARRPQAGSFGPTLTLPRKRGRGRSERRR